jgi:hypothetical protein
MRAVVVYESMFGNTHTVADHIARGMGAGVDVAVVPVERATVDLVADADLVVVGGPTHVHGMSTKTSRSGAKDTAASDDDLALDPDAEGPGLRDWFDGLAGHDTPAAAFDTRVDAPAVLTGRASKGIARRLRHHGFALVVDPESFLVDKENHLIVGEDDRAETWGAALAATIELKRSRT